MPNIRIIKEFWVLGNSQCTEFLLKVEWRPTEPEIAKAEPRVISATGPSIAKRFNSVRHVKIFLETEIKTAVGKKELEAILTSDFTKIYKIKTTVEMIETRKEE